jgi:branched-subunit amino acid aminotransferase/4-amino-4-deoxychorismate lyase
MTLLAVSQLGRGVVPVDEPVFHADDEGVLRGRAVFETMRVYGGRPFRLAEHLLRLAASAERVGLPAPDADGFRVAATEAVDAGGSPDAVLRFIWSPGREGRGEPLGLAFVSPLPGDLDALRERGLTLASIPWAATAMAGAKSTSYAANLAARDAAVGRGFDDALLVGWDGVVLESSVSNVWWRVGETLATPTLDLPILRGVTRGAVRELALAAGYEVEEVEAPIDLLLDADEVFLTSSVREVMPVVAVDGRSIGPGLPGRGAAALQDALRTAATAL